MFCGQALCPSDMPMSEPIERGNPLHFFYFAVCNLELRGFGKRIHKRDILNKTSILSVVGGTAGVSLS